jgi:hypothetical protein
MFLADAEKFCQEAEGAGLGGVTITGGLDLIGPITEGRELINSPG